VARLVPEAQRSYQEATISWPERIRHFHADQPRLALSAVDLVDELREEG